MSRTSDNPKNYRVNLRINEEMNNKLIEKSEKNGISITEYVRNLIETQNAKIPDANKLQRVADDLRMDYSDFENEIVRLVDSDRCG